MPKPALTQLLLDLSEGQAQAADELVPLLYQDLRRIAHNHLYRERADHTLSTTALVHEAYLKLIDQDRAQWQNRAHFFATASNAMRRILVDYARRRRAEKRGGSYEKVALTDALMMAESRSEDLLALDEALNQLAHFDPRAAQIVEYRFFGGLKVEETATVLGISPTTVKRDWHMAKVWLFQAMVPSAD